MCSGVHCPVDLYIIKPGKKFDPKKLILIRGIAFEKMARQDWNMRSKCPKNGKWPKITCLGN